MRRVTVLGSSVVAFFLAVLAAPQPALAGPASGQVEHTVTGTVVYLGPLAFAVDTGPTIETFRIPPGVPWAAGLEPNARVTLTWKAVPVETSRAVVRVEPASLPAPAAVTTGVEGRVAFIDSAEMAVATDRGVRTFAFGPDFARPQELVTGDDVRITYEKPPATIIDASHVPSVRTATARQRRAFMMVGRPTGAPAAAATPATPIHTVTGEVVATSPDLVVLATARGLQDFAINRASRLTDACVGDDLRVRYERRTGGAQSVATRSYPDILHTS